MKRSLPRLVRLEIIDCEKRRAGRRMTGVRPLGAKLRPHLALVVEGVRVAADTVGEIAGWSHQAAMSWTKREVRVAARGLPRSQASRRATFRAAAVATCCRWVLARPT